MPAQAAGVATAQQPVPHGWALPGVPPAAVRPRPPREPWLVVRAGLDRRVAVGALASAVLFDLVAHNGLVTIAATAWFCVVAAALLVSGRIRGRAGQALAVAAGVLAVMLTLRSSPWVIVPVVFAIVLALVLAVSLGADRSGPGATFPSLAGRMVVVASHLVLAPGMLRPRGEPASRGKASMLAGAVARGVLLGAPILIAVGLLLSWADPIFRSWFDVGAMLQHAALLAVGAWIAIGLARAASAERPVPPLPSALSLGAVEAGLVLGGLCALYIAFVAAQFAALSGGGHYVLVTHGLTYAQYARHGFFQLLACAGITLLVLLGIRACADLARPVLAALSYLTVALTIGIVVVAVRRLMLYEAVFGLTMLRLACLVAAAWIGVVFVLTGAALGRRGLPGRLLPAAVIASGLVFVFAWGVSNPASIVAQVNLTRAEHGSRLDVRQVVSLGPDAVPALVAGLARLDPAVPSLRSAICALPIRHWAGLAFNGSLSAAGSAVDQAC